MRAAILAGGFGTRARSLTDDRIPKAFLPVGGTPIVFHQMRMLRREGVTRLTVLGGHLGGQLEAPLQQEAAKLGITLDVIIEPAPLGTAGCLAALAPADEDTLIVFGDMLFDMALRPLARFHAEQSALITVVAHPNDHPRTSDLVSERDGRITGIFPRSATRIEDQRNLVPAGVFLAAPAFFRHIRPVKSDIMADVLPRVVADGLNVACYITPEYLRDVGTPERHAAAEKDLAGGLVTALNLTHRRPAIFFDCDGVLNEEPGLQGALKPDDVVLVPGAAAAVARARAARHLTIGITNRPQVARGDITFDDLDGILGRLEALLAEERGMLDRIYVCPHHPDRGFPGEVAALKIACECRKPGSLLFRRACADLPVEVARSAAIGDSLRDIGAAQAAGIWAYGVRTGHACRDGARYPGGADAAPRPELMFDDVGEAVDFALSYTSITAPIITRLDARLGRSDPLIVGIAGPSRAGKSVLAHALVRSLADRGLTSLHLRLDDWIVPAGERPPQTTSEARNRVDRLPDIFAAIRAGSPVASPGYDPATRGRRAPVTYDPGNCAVIVFDGVFALHPSVRATLDLAVFVEPSADVERARFDAFYRWKGFDDAAVHELWRERWDEERPRIAAQRPAADLVLQTVPR